MPHAFIRKGECEQMAETLIDFKQPADDLVTAPSAIVDVVAPAGVGLRLAAVLRQSGVAVGGVVTDPADLVGDDAAPPGLRVTVCDLYDSAKAVVGAVRETHADSRIVLVAPPMHRLEVLRALEAGADGVVADDRIEGSLCATVAAVAAGQLAFPREMRHQVRKPALSVREKQVLGMVVIGFSNGEVADKLFLAESTVKSHLTSAFSKLGVRSRKEAAALILDPDSGIGTGILTITGASNGAPDRAL
jgi:DNA-binding NarL/FixJ family response regulator